MPQTLNLNHRPMCQRLPLVALLAALTATLSAQPIVRPWEVVEIELETRNASDNFYLSSLPPDGATLVRATFSGTSGEALALGQEFTLDGFWDGNQTFRVRFAPPTPGTWTYHTSSADPSLHGTTGSFQCVAWNPSDTLDNPTRRGFVQVRQTGARPGRLFEYADGTPFLWIGDTWWNWTKRGINFDSFRKLADDRADKGFTVGQLFFAGRGWGRQSSLLNPDYTKPDLDHVRHVEAMIRYANQRGLTVWIHPWWGGADINRTIGPENIRRWWRYVVARLAAYNVIWTLAGEYNLNNYGSLGLEFWKQLGTSVAAWDPYERLLSTHPTPPGWSGGAEAPQWSTGSVLHQEPWLNYHQSQVGHGRWRNEMIPIVVQQDYAHTPAKPIVVTEPWYEFIEGNPTAADIRFGMLSALMSGAAGHSYAGGHVWKAHLPEAPAGRDSWPMEMEFNRDTLNYPGARSIGFIARLLKDRPWWTLEPHPELVLDFPLPYCLANPGHEYLVYIRWNGTFQLDLRGSSASETFTRTWIDLTRLESGQPETVQGGAIREFHCPKQYPGTPDVSDWLLHLIRQ